MEIDEISEMTLEGAPPAPAADEVDAAQDNKELTDFEVQMDIKLLELVYSHLKGESI